ncbi:tetraspanin-33-like isoform X2 [Dysidea avara]|uniref:tetraspanin-33-like isoform X2 n=1 Tax=Dysidea avara TaxID=196820 RepID=UPI0033292E28
MAGCCNLLAKFFLFVVNILIWILGGALLAIGIIAELQKEDYGDVSSSVLASPAIICIIIGSVLFLLGLLGAVGALVELYYVLMIYVLLLFIILLVEIGVAVFIYVQNDETEDIIREQMEELIKEYRNDPDLQDLIDSIQSDLLECCGIDRPDDWQLNPYFNCSSPSLQACSVPFSCCLPTGSRSQLIYTNGCYGEFEELIENVLPILGGILLGIFVLEVLSIFLTVGLVVDIRNEKSRARKWHKAHPKQRKKKKTELENFTLVSPSHK